MTTPDFRALCAELADALERLQNQAVTAPHIQFIELSNGRHPIPLGSDILVQDLMLRDLLARARAATPACFDNATDSAIREYLVTWINSLRLRDQGRDDEEDALLEQLDGLWRRIQAAIQPLEAATPDPAHTAGFWERHTMGVCPVCGNKRCPKGSDPAPTVDGGEPLWRLMQEAAAEADDGVSDMGSPGYAAALRVVADWLEQRGSFTSADMLRAEAQRAEAP